MDWGEKNVIDYFWWVCQGNVQPSLEFPHTWAGLCNRMSYQLLTCSHLLAYLHSYINLTSLHMVNLYLHHSQAPGQPMSMFAPTVSQWFHRWVSWNSLFAVVLGSQKVPIGYPIYFWDGEEKGIYITDTSLYIHPFFCFKTGALGLFALRGLWAGPFWRSTLRSDIPSVSFSRPPVI